MQLTGEDAPADVKDLALRLLATDPGHRRRPLDEKDLANFFDAAAHADILR